MRPASWRAALGFAALLALLSVDRPGAVKLSLTPMDIERALGIARASDAERARFHAPYTLIAGGTLVERLEVITELRRCVLLGEERLKLGEWMFTQGVRAAEQALRPWRGDVTIVARVAFHLQNTYVDVPPYRIEVSTRSEQPPLTAVDRRTTPISSLPFQTPGGVVTSLVGALIETRYAAVDVGQNTRSISLFLDDRIVAQATVDFGRLE